MKDGTASPWPLRDLVPVRRGEREEDGKNGVSKP
jgi:hypothetical protein